ncbi:DNA-binding protein [Acidianus manzaensis]|uniref:Transcription elongation factor Spt4 n=2 Tax=Acidianus manzaensis TaxID=282676 RepID=A0A1W6JZV7_9CREN|nr:transcription elongation factor subunit Spt4 [Acidianus manzaensis]ARM75806.1 DNA-binding protein [Acidianus manzaensis]
MAKSVFKACKNCKALTLQEDAVCPVCGSSSFTDDWEGMIIILNDQSEIMQLIGAKKPWRYAINIK